MKAAKERQVILPPRFVCHEDRALVREVVRIRQQQLAYLADEPRKVAQ